MMVLGAQLQVALLWVESLVRLFEGLYRHQLVKHQVIGGLQYHQREPVTAALRFITLSFDLRE